MTKDKIYQLDLNTKLLALLNLLTLGEYFRNLTVCSQYNAPALAVLKVSHFSHDQINGRSPAEPEWLGLKAVKSSQAHNDGGYLSTVESGMNSSPGLWTHLMISAR